MKVGSSKDLADMVELSRSSFSGVNSNKEDDEPSDTETETSTTGGGDLLQQILLELSLSLNTTNTDDNDDDGDDDGDGDDDDDNDAGDNDNDNDDDSSESSSEEETESDTEAQTQAASVDQNTNGKNKSKLTDLNSNVDETEDHAVGANEDDDTTPEEEKAEEEKKLLNVVVEEEGDDDDEDEETEPEEETETDTDWNTTEAEDTEADFTVCTNTTEQDSTFQERHTTRITSKSHVEVIRPPLYVPPSAKKIEALPPSTDKPSSKMVANSYMPSFNLFRCSNSEVTADEKDMVVKMAPSDEEGEQTKSTNEGRSRDEHNVNKNNSFKTSSSLTKDRSYGYVPETPSYATDPSTLVNAKDTLVITKETMLRSFRKSNSILDGVRSHSDVAPKLVLARSLPTQTRRQNISPDKTMSKATTGGFTSKEGKLWPDDEQLEDAVAPKSTLSSDNELSIPSQSDFEKKERPKMSSHQKLKAVRSSESWVKSTFSLRQTRTLEEYTKQNSILATEESKQEERGTEEQPRDDKEEKLPKDEREPGAPGIKHIEDQESSMNANENSGNDTKDVAEQKPPKLALPIARLRRRIKGWPLKKSKKERKVDSSAKEPDMLAGQTGREKGKKKTGRRGRKNKFLKSFAKYVRSRPLGLPAITENPDQEEMETDNERYKAIIFSHSESQKSSVSDSSSRFKSEGGYKTDDDSAGQAKSSFDENTTKSEGSDNREKFLSLVPKSPSTHSEGTSKKVGKRSENEPLEPKETMIEESTAETTTEASQPKKAESTTIPTIELSQSMVIQSTTETTTVISQPKEIVSTTDIITTETTSVVAQPNVGEKPTDTPTVLPEHSGSFSTLQGVTTKSKLHDDVHQNLPPNKYGRFTVKTDDGAVPNKYDAQRLKDEKMATELTIADTDEEGVEIDLCGNLVSSVDVIEFRSTNEHQQIEQVGDDLNHDDDEIEAKRKSGRKLKHYLPDFKRKARGKPSDRSSIPSDYLNTEVEEEQDGFSISLKPKQDDAISSAIPENSSPHNVVRKKDVAQAVTPGAKESDRTYCDSPRSAPSSSPKREKQPHPKPALTKRSDALTEKPTREALRSKSALSLKSKEKKRPAVNDLRVYIGGEDFSSPEVPPRTQAIDENRDDVPEDTIELDAVCENRESEEKETVIRSSKVQSVSLDQISPLSHTSKEGSIVRRMFTRNSLLKRKVGGRPAASKVASTPQGIRPPPTHGMDTVKRETALAPKTIAATTNSVPQEHPLSIPRLDRPQPKSKTEEFVLQRWRSVQQKINASLKKAEVLASHYGEDIGPLLEPSASVTTASSVGGASLSNAPKSVISNDWEEVEKKIDASLSKVEQLANRFGVDPQDHAMSCE